MTQRVLRAARFAIDQRDNPDRPIPITSLTDLHMLVQCEGGRERTPHEVHALTVRRARVELVQTAPMSPLDVGPVPRQPVSDIVHGRLRGQILSGRLSPGEALPSERTLSEAFGVNRHAVREALKRLQQAGLVQISHGGATRVLDWRAHGGLDLLFDLAPAGEEPPPEIVRSLLELRATVGVDAARRCAQRAPKRARRAIAQLAARTAQSVLRGDPAAGFDEYERLWQLIVDGSRNLAYRLALNSLVAGARDVPAALEHLGPGEPADVEELGRAIERGAADDAAAVAQRLLEPPTA